MLKTLGLSLLCLIVLTGCSRLIVVHPFTDKDVKEEGKRLNKIVEVFETRGN